jgi:hypothetical protein
MDFTAAWSPLGAEAGCSLRPPAACQSGGTQGVVNFAYHQGDRGRLHSGVVVEGDQLHSRIRQGGP